MVPGSERRRAPLSRGPGGGPVGAGSPGPPHDAPCTGTGPRRRYPGGVRWQALRASGALAAAAFGLCAGCAGSPPTTAREAPAELRVSRVALGTLVEIVIRDPDDARARRAVEAGFTEIARLEGILSEWRDTSDVSRLDAAAAGTWVRLSPETASALREARRIAADTDGAFDPTVLPLVRLWGFAGGPPRVPGPSEIERTLAHVGWRGLEVAPDAPLARLLHPGMAVGLGGIGKGFIADRVLGMLRRAGVPAAMVAAAGDLAFYGGSAGRPWPIGIEDPEHPGRVLFRLALRSGAVSTSAATYRFFESGGRRFHHILDPRSGRPAEGARSVTVVADRATLTDAYATGIFVLGRRGPEFVERHPGLRAVIVLADGSRWVSPGLNAAPAHEGGGPSGSVSISGAGMAASHVSYSGTSTRKTSVPW